MKRKQIKAFSLLEIGLVLLIMGALGLSVGPILNKQLQQQHNKITRNKHQCIAESLAAYVLQNRCLPPASLPSQGGESVPKKYVGIVPYKTLNLDQKMVKDQNGFWFTYAVNESLTDTYAQHDNETDELRQAFFCTVKPENDIPKIKDCVLNKDCIAFVLVAHHKGNGAIKSDDSREFHAEKNTTQSNLEALNASGGGTFSSEHVRDIVFWTSRYNFMAQIAKKPCINETTVPEITSHSPSALSIRGERAFSATNNANARTLQKCFEEDKS